MHAAPSPASWHVGRYFIGVFALIDSTFTVTAYESGRFGLLTDGEAAVGSCDSNAPALWSYVPPDVQGSAPLPAIRLSVSAGLTQPLVVYVCSVARCIPGRLTGYNTSFAVAAGARSDIVLGPSMRGFCSAPPCEYSIGIYPGADACVPPACSAFFSVTAQALVGNSTTVLPYGAIVNRVYGRESVVRADAGATADVYEVMLPAAPGAVTVTVDACVGVAEVFACK